MIIILLVPASIGCVTSISRESITNNTKPNVAKLQVIMPTQPVVNIIPEATLDITPNTPAPTAIPVPTAIPAPTEAVSPTSFPPTNSPTPAPASTKVTPTETIDPILEILGPLNNTSFTSDSVIIYGISDPGTNITINESISQIDTQGNFYSEVELVTGINQFTIESKSAGESLITKTINIFKSAPQTLFISITQPLNQTVISSSYVQISGLTSPDAKLTIDDVQVPITIERLDAANKVGLFEHVYQLGLGLNLSNINVSNDSGDSIDKLISVIHSN